MCSQRASQMEREFFLGKSRMVSNSFESTMIFTLSLQKMNGTKEGPYAYQVTGAFAPVLSLEGLVASGGSGLGWGARLRVGKTY